MNFELDEAAELEMGSLSAVMLRWMTERQKPGVSKALELQVPAAKASHAQAAAKVSLKDREKFEWMVDDQAAAGAMRECLGVVAGAAGHVVIALRGADRPDAVSEDSDDDANEVVIEWRDVDENALASQVLEQDIRSSVVVEAASRIAVRAATRVTGLAAAEVNSQLNLPRRKTLECGPVTDGSSLSVRHSAQTRHPLALQDSPCSASSSAGSSSHSLGSSARARDASRHRTSAGWQPCVHPYPVQTQGPQARRRRETTLASQALTIAERAGLWKAATTAARRPPPPPPDPARHLPALTSIALLQKRRMAVVKLGFDGRDLCCRTTTTTTEVLECSCLVWLQTPTHPVVTDMGTH